MIVTLFFIIKRIMPAQLRTLQKRLKSTRNTVAGFTLIETIITIVIVAFVVTMIIVYFGKGILHSSDPIARLNSEALLAKAMEKITLQYTRYQHWRPGTNYAAAGIVLPTTPNHNGYLYTTIAGGTSGANEPYWSITSPGTTPDGTVSWQWAASCAPDLTGACAGANGCNCPAGLQAAIGTEGGTGNSTFGNFIVIQNHFIKFDSGGNEVSLAGNTTDPYYGLFLKVTIGPPTNALTSQTLSTMFVLR